MTTDHTMSSDASPSATIDLLLAQLEEIQRGPHATIAIQNALRHAKACEECLARHDEHMAKQAAADAMRDDLARRITEST